MEIADGFFYQPRALNHSPSFTLLDSGYGQKLEKIDNMTFVRPEPQALWQPSKPAAWQDVTAQFKTSAQKNDNNGQDSEASGLGKWAVMADMPDKWPINHFGVELMARLTPFRHYGFFPEQALLWPEMLALSQATEKPTALNLFAYSGMASLLLADHGVAVTHVDASKKAILYAEENISRDKGVKLLIDDAVNFVRREIRRGKTYNLILLDPPKFGRGPKGEGWDIWQDLPELLSLLPSLLAPGKPSAVFLTAYAIRGSCYSFGRALREYLTVPAHRATTTFGELSLTEEARGFYIPQALYAIHQGEG